MKALALVVVLAVSVSAQEIPAAQPPGQAQAPQAQASQAPAGPSAAPAFVYNPEGRRDPFVSLLKRADTRSRQGKQPAAGGVSGFLVSELVLKGIMQSRNEYLALVTGPDAKTYLVRVNDRLQDGSVRAITADALVCLQDVSDPLSLTKQREVRLTLRAVTEAK